MIYVGTVHAGISVLHTNRAALRLLTWTARTLTATQEALS